MLDSYQPTSEETLPTPSPPSFARAPKPREIVHCRGCHSQKADEQCLSLLSLHGPWDEQMPRVPAASSQLSQKPPALGSPCNRAAKETHPEDTPTDSSQAAKAWWRKDLQLSSSSYIHLEADGCSVVPQILRVWHLAWSATCDLFRVASNDALGTTFDPDLKPKPRWQENRLTVQNPTTATTVTDSDRLPRTPVAIL